MNRLPSAAACAAILTLAATQARATTVGPLVELTASPEGAECRKPSLSYDVAEDLYVIAWEDYRAETTNLADVFLATVSADPMDPTGGTLIIADDNTDGTPDSIDLNLDIVDALPASQTTPVIAYDGAGVHAVVWRDLRSGDPEIRAARFFGNTKSVFQDVSVSGTGNLDGEPDVDFSNATFLMTWRRTTGTTVEVFGRRFFDDLLDVDSSPVNLSGTTRGGAPAVTAVGNTFYVAWSDGSDVYGRTVPGDNMQTIPSATATLIDTSTETQDVVDLSTIGTAQLYSVWRQRSALGSDVYGDRVNVALASLGNRAGISTGRSNELEPKVDGDATGALVVWQDFRNGVNSPAVYGARIDDMGVLRDDRGFPLVDLPGGAFEQTVVKGPGQDYLVAGVRRQITTGSPEERIFFRLVRDEDPAGMMTNVGDDNVPADGETRAGISFGPAQGPSGLDVADETVYTLEWTSADIVNLTIEPADIDGDATNGHQLFAQDGEVAFDLSTTERGMVDLVVTSDQGTAMGTDTIVFRNVPPVASNALLQGAASMDDRPRSRDSLALSYDYFDVNDDVEAGTEITWREDGQVNNAPYQNTPAVPAGALFKGSTWNATIEPNDGTDLGNRLVSNSVTIINSPPTAVGVRICEIGGVCANDPAFELVGTTDGIRVDFGFQDVDPVDVLSGQTVRWFLDGVVVPDLADATEVSGDRIVKGQTWRYGVVVFDGEEFSEEEVFSSTVTVQNIPPVARAGDNIEATERTMVQLDGSGSFDLDFDDLTFQWEQTDGPAVELDDPTSARPSFMAPNIATDRFLNFTLTVNDGSASNGPVNTPTDAPMSERNDPVVAVAIRALPDADNDKLDDEQEMMLGTDPMRADTDRDGLPDGYDPSLADLPSERGEVSFVDLTPRSNPLDEDSDDDGLRDGNEGRTSFNEAMGQAPHGDADGDGISNVNDPDSDNDGLFDGLETGRQFIEDGDPANNILGTDESAGFFVPDADRGITTTNPLDPDTDGDGFDDGVEDANGNGIVDEGETDPNDPNDPGQACTGDGDCPAGFTCSPSGVCEQGDIVVDCSGDTLAADGLECCNGSTFVEPICTAPAGQSMGRERCPAGASPTQIGTCSGDGDTGAGGDSGGCAGLPRGDLSPALLAGLLGVVALRRRRGARDQVQGASGLRSI